MIHTARKMVSIVHCILQIIIIYHVRGEDKNKLDDEEDQNIYFKDDSFKPALFGSSSYDPIKEVFEPVKNKAHTTSESQAAASNHTGSTVGQSDFDDTHHPSSSTVHGAGRERDPFFRQHGSLVSKFVLQNFSSHTAQHKPTTTESSMYMRQRVPIKVIKLD